MKDSETNLYEQGKKKKRYILFRIVLLILMVPGGIPVGVQARYQTPSASATKCLSYSPLYRW
jgi:hypothetical protein